jgi:flagellar biosynthetic protein FlhB
MADDSGDKTEEPTQKRLDDARRKGQVWKSRDFTGVVVFLVGLGTLKGMAPTIRYELNKLCSFAFDKVAHPVDLEHATYGMTLMAAQSVVVLTLPVVAACAVAGALVDFLQVGPLFSVESVMPKADKLNIINGIKNMFSKKQLVELLKSSVKIGVTGYVVYGVVRDAMPMVAETIHGTADTMLDVLAELIERIAIRVSVLFFMFAGFDLWFQRRSYMQQMMMSKEEIKREYKESEGDPHHKAKRRELHHEILEGAQMQQVKKSDVVVTNPDHVAVAIKYDKEADGAPRVICKGVDSRAEAIKALAKEGDVPLLRNVPLAHALLRVEAGEEIPETLYDAVAEVLQFVYGLRQGSGAQASPL